MSETNARKWMSINGGSVTFFSVTGDGMNGRERVIRLKELGYDVSGSAKKIFNSPDFKPTPKGVEVRIAVFNGHSFIDAKRYTGNIIARATRARYQSPALDIGCLTIEKFTDAEIEEMGFWHIAFMHSPVCNSVGNPELFCRGRFAGKKYWTTCCGKPEGKWAATHGFGFTVPDFVVPI